MKCLECGNECKEGIVEVEDARSLTQSFLMVNWFPIDENGKKIKKEAVNLQMKAKGYYCEECMKVYAEIEEK